jgi:hypothetical protein
MEISNYEFRMANESKVCRGSADLPVCQKAAQQRRPTDSSFQQ